MILKVKADIIGVLIGVVESVQPFAKANGITLDIESNQEYIEIEYRPDEVIHQFSNLLCRIITFTPQSNTVRVTISLSEVADSINICIRNTGSDLTSYHHILSGFTYSVNAKCNSKDSTDFELHIPFNFERENKLNDTKTDKKSTIRPFYAVVRQRLNSHFKDIENLEKAASNKSVKEGVFLKKMNAIIYNQLDNEKFSVENLAKKMALSRVQLFRKVKNLTQMSPRSYIRYVRLQKAKEILEKGELNVSEVAYQVGFVSNSHFSRSFNNQFGFNPSLLKPNKR